MELDPRLYSPLAKLGLTAFSLIAVATNRYGVRPRLKSPRYDKFSLPIEHFLKHFGYTALIDGLIEMRLLEANIPFTAPSSFSISGSVIEAFRQDMIMERKPQLDQIFWDLVGTLAYAVPALLLSHYS